MDFSGNNTPLNGGTYNPDGVTVADALSTATPHLPSNPVTPLTPASRVAPSAGAAPVAENDRSEQMGAAVPEQPFHHQQVQHHHHWDFG